MLYGSEIIDWEEKQILQFEIIQAKSLRTLLGADFQSNKGVLRLITGVESMKARFDFAKLNHFWKIWNSDPESLLGELHSSGLKINLPQSYHNVISRILNKYGLPDPSGFTKTSYANVVKSRVWEVNIQDDIKEARSSKCGQSLLCHVGLGEV